MTTIRQPKCKHGFRAGDIVWTPLRRRAQLTRYRMDEHWDARYLAAIDGSKQDETILDPKLIKHT